MGLRAALAVVRSERAVNVQPHDNFEPILEENLFRSGVTWWMAVLCWAGTAQAWQQAPLCAVEGVVEGPTTSEVHRRPSVLDAGNTCVSPAVADQPYGIPWTVSPTAADARTAMKQAQSLYEDGKPVDAVLQLRIVEATFPELTDRLALTRGDWLLSAQLPQLACAAYEDAKKSLDQAVIVQANVGAVRCRIAGDDARAEASLEELLRRYPRMPVADQLWLELGRHLERSGQSERAVGVYRNLNIYHPSTPAGRSAHEALATLSAMGVAVEPPTTSEAISRLEHMARYGPFEEARAGITTWLAKKDLSKSERARLYTLHARMTRIEGRWSEAQQAVHKAVALNPASNAARYLPPPQPHHAHIPDSTAAEQGTAQIQRLLGRRTLKHAPARTVIAVLDAAIHYGLSAPASDALDRLSLEVRLPPNQRFEAALRAVGVAHDQAVAAVLSTLLDQRKLGVAARYHYARALERMGDLEAANREYAEVIARERGDTLYYTMWSEQRIWAIDSATERSCVLYDNASEPRHVAPDVGANAAVDRSLWLASSVDPSDLTTPARQQPSQLLVSTRFVPSRPRPNSGVGGKVGVRRQAIRLLEPLIEEHDHAYPWLSRARALLEIDRFADAADEISELYLAYRDARGQARLRSGLASVFAGGPTPRAAMTPSLRRERLRLTQEDRQRLSRIANLLGDYGVGLRLHGYDAEARPRAYERDVEAAAARYELDPDLLFAVMRVESIYNRRILSHVGAVGLTQIMPRTGHLIAQALGDSHFDVPDLLEPQKNLHYSAWYLASLIRRFDGHLPLAIASYNGGPHNVRLWLRQAPPTMSMDAFLEHIPFGQTHRYVRRVLTHYAAYRRQRGLPLPRLSIHLPETKPDLLAF